MKKILVSFVAVRMCALMLTACGSTQTLNDTPLDVALAQINTAVFDGGESMRIIDSVDKLELYYSISPEDVTEFAAEVAKNSATEIDEVILVKVVDEAAAARIAEKLELRLQSQKDLCASYSADLLAVAEQSEVRTQGLLVSLIVTEQYDKAVSICDDILFS